MLIYIRYVYVWVMCVLYMCIWHIYVCKDVLHPKAIVLVFKMYISNIYKYFEYLFLKPKNIVSYKKFSHIYIDICFQT